MKIAVVGSGISGMGAAYMLSAEHDVTLYESEARVGGHSRTVVVDAPQQGHRQVPVDTGFIVFNQRNYPLLTALFQHLNVPTVESNMSFGLTLDGGRFEYGTRTPASVFAQPANLVRPRYWQMLRDITRFNRGALDYLDADLKVTLRDLIHEVGLGDWFERYYLLPMGASIWSTPLDKMLDYPAQTFTRFFKNHGLLTVADHPQWYTVQGGSTVYVEQLTRPFQEKIRLNCAVQQVMRSDHGVTLLDQKGHVDQFDQVVLACHADQALSMLSDPTSSERRILGAFSYQKNDMVLHSDTAFMPKRRRAWSSWVYRGSDHAKGDPSVSLTYWMNNLQPLPTEAPLLVTLNPSSEPDPSCVYDRKCFTHPVFDRCAIEAQAQIDQLQGVHRIWYCGAYQRYGFHEDGLWSAVRVVRKMGLSPAWLPAL